MKGYTIAEILGALENMKVAGTPAVRTEDGSYGILVQQTNGVVRVGMQTPGISIPFQAGVHKYRLDLAEESEEVDWSDIYVEIDPNWDPRSIIRVVMENLPEGLKRKDYVLTQGEANVRIRTAREKLNPSPQVEATE